MKKVIRSISFFLFAAGLAIFWEGITNLKSNPKIWLTVAIVFMLPGLIFLMKWLIEGKKELNEYDRNIERLIKNGEVIVIKLQDCEIVPIEKRDEENIVIFSGCYLNGIFEFRGRVLNFSVEIEIDKATLHMKLLVQKETNIYVDKICPQNHHVDLSFL